jgi:hypothetical protein
MLVENVFEKSNFVPKVKMFLLEHFGVSRFETLAKMGLTLIQDFYTYQFYLVPLGRSL